MSSNRYRLHSNNYFRSTYWHKFPSPLFSWPSLSILSSSSFFLCLVTTLADISSRYVVMSSNKVLSSSYSSSVPDLNQIQLLWLNPRIFRFLTCTWPVEGFKLLNSRQSRCKRRKKTWANGTYPVSSFQGQIVLLIDGQIFIYVRMDRSRV